MTVECYKNYFSKPYYSYLFSIHFSTFDGLWLSTDPVYMLFHGVIIYCFQIAQSFDWKDYVRVWSRFWFADQESTYVCFLTEEQERHWRLACLVTDQRVVGGASTSTTLCVVTRVRDSETQVSTPAILIWAAIETWRRIHLVRIKAHNQHWTLSKMFQDLIHFI